MTARVLLMRQERGASWGRPASRSTTGRLRRSARQRVVRRTARLKTLVRSANPLGRAAQPTDSEAQDHAHLRASNPAAPARPTLGGRELDSRRMSYAPGRPREVNRWEGRRTEQAHDEREWENALAREIHDFSGLLNWKLGRRAEYCWIRDSHSTLRETWDAAKSSLRGRRLSCRPPRAAASNETVTRGGPSWSGGDAGRRHQQLAGRLPSELVWRDREFGRRPSSLSAWRSGFRDAMSRRRSRSSWTADRWLVARPVPRR
jgi:hypothetical protein